jgi:hypothetical protein
MEERLMRATDTKVKFEIGFPGDDRHVAHRVGEVIKALTALGIRLEVRLEGGLVYLLSDHEDPVDSSTVDAAPAVFADPPPPAGEHETTAGTGGVVFPPPQPRLSPEKPVLDAETCGMAVCGHPKGEHVTSEPRATAGVTAARPRGTHCTVEIGPGVACNCPGFEPVTGSLRSKPGPY